MADVRQDYVAGSGILSIRAKDKLVCEMERDIIAVGDKFIHLIPGMSVTVDANVGERRLIKYILTPVMRCKNESLRER